MVNESIPGNINLNIDHSKIPNMECWCGGQVFMQVFNLKYISPLLCGKQSGMTLFFQTWGCLKCGTKYPGAMRKEDIEKMRPPENDAPGPGEVKDGELVETKFTDEN